MDSASDMFRCRRESLFCCFRAFSSQADDHRLIRMGAVRAEEPEGAARGVLGRCLYHRRQPSTRWISGWMFASLPERSSRRAGGSKSAHLPHLETGVCLPKSSEILPQCGESLVPIVISNGRSGLAQLRHWAFLTVLPPVIVRMPWWARMS
jgi:hypothetical protein